MSPEDYRRACELFLELVEVPGDQRDSALDAASGDNHFLRSEVWRMLEADSGAGAFLERGAISDGAMMLRASGDCLTKVPQTIAHYKILSKLGQGGMGEVWRAHDSKLQREVAIKILPDAFASDPERMARFAREAQVLALLNHPNIAAIHGSEDRALIMELVDGTSLLAHAVSNGLDTRRRLELMANVCDAVQHAHLRGVLHRDLKPANIFVDKTGQPKVLDFGVARMLDSDSSVTRQTDLGQLIGTFDYMSPEQTLGDPRTLDIRSDLYSLGVVLYELLAGRLPFESKGRALPEMLRMIREDDPVPLGAIDRKYSGDIETIVGKALEKNKERRYGSAVDLAADIRRYLADEPITAMPPGARYRAAKFVRRNRTVVVAAGAFVVLILGFGAAMAVLAARNARERDVAQTERARAQTERARADAVVDFLRNDVLAQADMDAQPGSKPDSNLRVRDALDRASARIEGKFAQQPLVEASVRQTIGETYSMIGQMPSAETHLERALAIRRKYLPPGHTDVLASLYRLGQLRRMLGRGDHGEALLREAVETGSKGPGEPNPEVFHAMGELGNTYMSMNRPDLAEPLYRRVHERRRRMSGMSHPISISTLSDLANSYDLQGKTGQALDLYRQAVEAGSSDIYHNVVPVLNLGNLYTKLGEFEKAGQYLTKARKVAEESMNEEYPVRLSILDGVGGLYRDVGRFKEAEELLRQVWEVRRRVLGDNSRNTLNSAASLGDLYCTEGKWAQGEKMLLDTLNTERRVLSDQDRFTQRTMTNLSLCYLRQHKFQGAEPWAARVVEVLQSQLGAHTLGVQTLGVQTKDALAVLADVRLHSGAVANTDSVLEEACPYPPAASPADWRGSYCRILRGMSLASAKLFEAAEPLLVSGYQGMLANRAKMPAGRMMHLADAKAAIARLYENWGKPEVAKRWK